MAAWWRNLGVLPARHGRRRGKFCRVLLLGIEPLESRQLLTGPDAVLPGDVFGGAAVIPNNGAPAAGFTVSRSMAFTGENGTPDSFSVVLTAEPDLDVVLTVISARPGELAVSPAVLTFTPADWNTPQSVTVVAVDDRVDDGAQYTDVAVGVDGESSDQRFAALDSRHVMVSTEDDDQAGIWLSKTTANVSENETTDTFAVRLTSQPVDNVVLTVISLDPGEAAVSPMVLTFSPVDWDVPQTVTVTGVDDSLLDGNVSTQVMVSTVDELSDAPFRGMFRAVHVATVDNDVAGFALSHSALTVSESGTSDTFTVVLTAKPEVSVTLTAIRSDAGEATASPAVLTIPPEDWDVPQTVTVTGVDDPLLDGDQTSWVTVSVAPDISDSRFAGVAPQAVSVTTTDDDNAGFTLSKSLALVSETGTTDSFTVVLTAQPENDVTLTVSGSDLGEATAGPATLVFTPAGWNSPQTVTITGADDTRRDGDQASQVIVAVDDSQSDEYFVGVLAQTVSVTTTDDDQGWQNSENPYDVTGNGVVDAADVLILINHVNGNAGRPALPSPPASPPPYYDVNNDGLCTAFDILLVINFINNQSGVGVSASSAGEGESQSPAATRLQATPLDAPADPSGDASGATYPIPATRVLVAPDPMWLSPAAKAAATDVTVRLVEPTSPPRAVLVPVPVADAAVREGLVSTRPGRTSDADEAPWSEAVDASLGDWDEGWEDALASATESLTHLRSP